jgi:uncharacterized membrane protein (DUF106 family)
MAAAAAGGTGTQPAAPSSSGMTWMFIFLFMMLILFSGNTRQILGDAIGIALNPAIGFHGTNPIWSIFVGTVIIVSISQTIRHFMTNWIKLADSQAYMKAFNKEISEARKSQNQQRLQKLMEMQSQMMSKQMEVQGMTMKPTIFTMVLFIAFITWIYTFVTISAVDRIAIPWNPEYVLEVGSLFSGGVLFIYILFTIPLSQMVVNIWKYISFTRRLKVLDAEEAMGEVTI